MRQGIYLYCTHCSSPVYFRFKLRVSCQCAATKTCYISYRVIVLKCSLELPQCHVGGGTAVISLNIVFVYLQGLRSVSQGIAIALRA